MMPLLSPPDNTEVKIRESGKSAIESGFPFAEISTIAEAESWRKEIYRPIYHIHKWWAQRLGSVFRSIILASVLPENAPVLDFFYRRNDLGGLVVFDPFMGSGTTVGEAIKLGCTVIGRDINPVAYNAVRAAFSRVSVKRAWEAFKLLERTAGEKVKSLYLLTDGSQCLYYFWVKQVACLKCGGFVDLFNSYVFSRHAYPSQSPKSQCVCPECGEVFSVLYDSSMEICPSCSFRFDPQNGPVGRTKATCPDCSSEFSILRAVKAAGEPPGHRLYAKMILRPDGVKEYRRITEDDLTAYGNAATLLENETPLIGRSSIEPGYNTNQVINYCYTRWEQFFNARQLLALSWLGRAIQAIEEPQLRFAFAILLSGTLEFNNMFCSFKGEGTGAVRHMFSHHILKPERQPLEANVWGTPKSSGSFSTLFKSRLLRALEYRAAPFEVEVTRKSGKVSGRKRYDCNAPISDDLHLARSAEEVCPRSVYLSCGDSAETDLHAKTVDLVITDPPFFDNVHYSELADFFYVWQRRLLGEPSGGCNTTRNPAEVQDRDVKVFSKKLAAVFSECHRVLKNNGILAFTYHHSRNEGWSSVAHAVASAGFSFVCAQPVKSEMSVAVPKRQAKEPIDLDVILVCRKREQDKRPFSAIDTALRTCAENTRTQLEQFWRCGRRLSRNDLRIVILSHLLVALSPGRTEIELMTDFEACSVEVSKEIEQLFSGQQAMTPNKA